MSATHYRWELRCHECKHQFPDDTTAGVLQQHFVIEHPVAFVRDENVNLDLMAVCAADDTDLTVSRDGNHGICPECGSYWALRPPQGG